MKKLMIYFGCFAGMCVIFTTCYYMSYKRVLKQFLEQTEERDYNLLMELRATAEEIEKNNNMQINTNLSNGDLTNQDAEDNQSIHVGMVDIETVQPQAKFFVESYNIKTNELITEEYALPGEYVGLARDEVIHKLSNYMGNIPLSEFEKGLFAYELLSFSKDKLTVRKSYNQDLVTFKYYVAIRDGYVIVYYSDLKTVYEYTAILAINLPETERDRLMHGIYLNSNAELYELLESYSS